MYDTFLALAFRMKHISRWSLMHNTQNESLSQHTLECALITHYLASVGNSFFNKAYDADKLAVCALFHDVTEVLTGDLPTPIKYYNPGMRDTYKDIENAAARKLLEHFPEQLREPYGGYMGMPCLSGDERFLVKIADKLCAYIKCVAELNAGNGEFLAAHAATRAALEEYSCPELDYFLEHCLPAFSLSLDELEGTL